MTNLRPIIHLDRDAQIVALWLGRPCDQRRPADIDRFYRWLVDYVPWLVPAEAEAASLEQIRALIRPHTIEDDGMSVRTGKRVSRAIHPQMSETLAPQPDENR